jgi:Tetracyclin repressor-like, C-terminal domain
VLRAAAVRNTMAGLPADLAVDPDVADAFQTACAEPNRAKMREVLQRAAVGGEVAADADADVLTDLLFGAVLWRALFSGRPLDEAFIRGLVERLAASVQPAPPLQAPR